MKANIKQLFIYLNQLEELQKSIKIIPGEGRHRFIGPMRRYNDILERVKKILSADEDILQTIENLEPINPKDHLIDGVITGLACLTGTVRSYIQIHCPSKEKDKIGF